MQDSDAKGFERALARLCAAFDVPVTDARREAYWRSFRKLKLLEFTGLVDVALVESTFASMPTVGALWELFRKVAQAPATQVASGPSIQAQLCEYAAQHVHDLAGPKDGMTLWEYSRPWTYVYREWIDASKATDVNPEGKCAECIGLVIDLANGKRIGWSVAAMLDDVHGHAKALRAFKPGPAPTDEQRAAWHSKVGIPLA